MLQLFVTSFLFIFHLKYDILLLGDFMFKYSKNRMEIFEDSKYGYLKYSCDRFVTIDEINCDDELMQKLLNKLVVLTYYKGLNYIYYGNVDLSKYHYEKIEDFYFLERKNIKIRRFIKIGDGETGKKNNICDVNDVCVSHFTVNDTPEFNTGITVVSPHSGNIFREKVVGASYVFNGFGKSIGLVQIDELGTIETNIALTTTLNVGKVADAVVQNSLEENPEIGISTGTCNPVVLECNDGSLNNSRERILGRQSYRKALDDLKDDFEQGAVGAGSGMTCHGFKGGIGSSSRKVVIDSKEYTIGVLLNSNFGESNGKNLFINGHYMGDKIQKYLEEYEDKGSIVVVFATDLPLDERQIRRILKRCEIGIGRTGSYAGNGSGDLFVGFTTANKVKHFNDTAITTIERIADGYLNTVFKRTVEAVEEAVLNSMLFSKHVKGYLKEVKALGEVNEIFYDLIDEVIDYE